MNFCNKTLKFYFVVYKSLTLIKQKRCKATIVSLKDSAKLNKKTAMQSEDVENNCIFSSF